MKNIAIIIAFLLSNANTSAQKNDSSVFFNKKIEWSLFKGKPNNDSSGASISTSIYLEVVKVNIWNGTIYFKAYALMNPFKSWVKPDYADLYTLQHEQTHFNLTEICARNLQSELNRMKIKSRKSPIVQATLDKWQNKMEDLQAQYDKETKGGNDSLAQKTWNEKVLVELKKTK